MNLPKAMSHTAREHNPPSMRSLMALLIFLVILGVAGTTASILNARQTTAASQADVRRNAMLIEELRRIQEQQDASVDSQHDDLCRLIYSVVQATPRLREAGIKPCRMVA